MEISAIQDLYTAQVNDVGLANIRSILQQSSTERLNDTRRRLPGLLRAYMIVDNVLCHIKKRQSAGTVWLPVVPVSLRVAILQACHDSPSAGDLGQEKTYIKVTARFWWRGLRQDVVRHVQTC